MRVLFIVNPAAGKGRAKREWERIAPRLAELSQFDVQFTTAPGEATRLAREAASQGYDRIASVGGDGTLFEVVNGVCGTGAALAILPGGTGNDYAKCVGLPTDMLEAATVALRGSERMVDVGRSSSGIYFINVAGAGFDAEVAANVNRYPKHLGGTIPYVMGILKTMWQFVPQEMEIELDDRVITQKSLLIAIGLGKSYGAGMKITPDADVSDGLFDVCIGGDLGRLELLGLLPQLYKGTHVTHPKVEMARCSRIAVRSTGPIAAQADGELIGSLPLELSVLPGHLRLVVSDASQA